MIAFILLLIINIVILYSTREPQVLMDVRERYRILREHIQDTDHTKFKVLVRPIPIVGKMRMHGSIGSNTNKGSEIVVCIDGKVNDIFHVLLHELSHSTVEEYSHSEAFWKNYTELSDMAITLGIYEKIPERVKFCGRHIQDK